MNASAAKGWDELAPRRFTGHDGLDLVADVGGARDGCPVILLHGGGQTRHSWRNAAQTLITHGYRVAVLDQRGHGDSGWSSAGNYDFDTLSSDLRVVIGEMRGAPILVGASLGGLVSLITTGEGAPDLVRGLVLVDVTPTVDPAGRARIVDFMQQKPDGFLSLDEAADAIQQYLPHRERPRNLDGLRRNLRQRADGRWYWHWDPRFFDVLQRSSAFDEVRFIAAAHAVTIPTLLIRGARSELVKPEHVEQFLRAIPHAEHVDVPDATHMIAGDRNDAFNAVVLNFLGRFSGATWKP